MARVVCAGHVNWDVAIRVDRLPERDGEAPIEAHHQSGGGSAANAAVALAGLDVESHLLGSVGLDGNGWLVRRDLADRGVETHLVETDEPTAVKYLIVEGDGEVRVLGAGGANEAYAAADLPTAALEGADVLHLTNQDPATAAELARSATEADVSVSFDPGRRVTDRDYAKTVAMTDVLFVNDREFADGDGIDDVPVLVQKRGSEGAAVHTDGKIIEHPGFLVDPVDTIGAGDAFDAGFLAARLRGDDLERALAIGNACGALAARITGAQLSIGWQDVEAVLDVGPAE